MLNNINQPVAQIKVQLNEGIGKGSLTIPDSLSTGNYRIITYTSWMRNFNPDYFFSKDISIINPQKRIVPHKNISLRGGSTIKFFPEGGNLIYELNSKVAFQAVNSNGQGINFKGHILDERNDTILKIEPLKFGIGNFSFTPHKGKKYKAVIQTKEGSFIEDLPSPYDSGYVMTLNSEMNKNVVNITIHGNQKGITGKKVYLFTQSRQRIRRVMAAELDNAGRAIFNISENELEDGISHFTIFDHELKPLAERLHFHQINNILKINIDQPKCSYTKKGNVTISINTLNQSNKSISAHLSLSVFKVDELQHYDSLNIVNYLLLTSDLKGRIENPSYYLTPGGDEKKQAIDNLMLTHGWSRFKWQDVLENNWPVTHFGPDHEGMTVRAIITNTSDVAIANANVFLSALARSNQVYAARSNNRGILQFYVRHLYGKNEIAFQQLGDTSKFNITLLNPFTEKYPSQPYPAFTTPLPPSNQGLIRSYSIHTQAQKAFYKDSIASTHIDAMPFFGTPDKSYLLSDYVSFPQVKDVLKEYVFEVMVKRRDQKSYLVVLDKSTQIFFESEPFVLLDGIPIFNTERIVNLSAQHIRKLEVVNKKIFYGPFTFNGIISLTSDSSRVLNTQVNPEVVVFDFEGIQKRKEFYTPIYNENEERLPDFRNVLTWVPEINTDAKGKSTITFLTSELPGKYIGVLNGITNKGLIGSTTFQIEVR